MPVETALLANDGILICTRLRERDMTGVIAAFLQVHVCVCKQNSTMFKNDFRLPAGPLAQRRQKYKAESGKNGDRSYCLEF